MEGGREGAVWMKEKAGLATSSSHMLLICVPLKGAHLKVSHRAETHLLSRLCPGAR